MTVVERMDRKKSAGYNKEAVLFLKHFVATLH